MLFKRLEWAKTGRNHPRVRRSQSAPSPQLGRVPGRAGRPWEGLTEPDRVGVDPEPRGRLGEGRGEEFHHVIPSPDDELHPGNPAAGEEPRRAQNLEPVAGEVAGVRLRPRLGSAPGGHHPHQPG
ncbi:MAG: hypothetical protein H5T71_07435, partial [Chloroflexi bacterium]|nr:hypothetical protein [Chloroflexota bacterium]